MSSFISKGENPGTGHVDNWIFDLDNTLYPATANLFAQIDRRMKTFIAGALGLSPDAAFVLQKQYFRRYGTTLRGLMLNHSVEPDAFLDYVHDIDHSVLTPDPHLAAALGALRGRNFIYTNGSHAHAEAVVDKLGVAHLFAGIFDIRAGDYMPKPEPEPYRAMVARHGIDPTRAAMFEDSHANLKPAAAMGMVTIWVKHHEHVVEPGEDLSHCRFVTEDLVGWLREAGKHKTS